MHVRGEKEKKYILIQIYPNVDETKWEIKPYTREKVVYKREKISKCRWNEWEIKSESEKER